MKLLAALTAFLGRRNKSGNPFLFVWSEAIKDLFSEMGYSVNAKNGKR